MPRAASTTRDQGLFLSEEEIARRVGQTLPQWKATAKILERDGLPRVHSLMQGRYWRAVQAYFDRTYGLATFEVSQPDGEENLDVL